MRLFIITAVLFLTLQGCVIRHNTINKTYHGTNGRGGHWLAWRTPNALPVDSAAIVFSSYNATAQDNFPGGYLFIVNQQQDTTVLVNDEPRKPISVRLVPGKYFFGYQPSLVAASVYIKRFRLSPKDSVAFTIVAPMMQGPIQQMDDRKYGAKRKKKPGKQF